MPDSYPAAIDERPRVLLAKWGAFEVRLPQFDVPTFHLVGLRDASVVARVSSPISQLSADGLRVRTSTGRLYDLVGPPGLTADALAHWRRWLGHWSAEVISDATDALARLQAAKGSNFQRTANWHPLGKICQTTAVMPVAVLLGPEEPRVH